MGSDSAGEGVSKPTMLRSSDSVKKKRNCVMFELSQILDTWTTSSCLTVSYKRFAALETQGPEELNLYARIILRTSYLIKYITTSFDQ